jgi:D-alanyl-D-alanine carboxypeptidase/D-alanyl-D-alanine-endopeptidase (penicillin-binding protein 4)
MGVAMTHRMRFGLRLGLCLWLAALPAAAHAADPLTSALDGVLAGRALHGAKIGALVVSRDDGRVLYARNPDASFVPASNQKVLTAAAALATFGPTHSFPIEVFAAAEPDAEGTVSTLYFRGGGDPSLTSEDFWRLAADLRMKGITRVTDGLVIDDGAFDSQLWHPAWGSTSARAYHAPSSAFSVNYGSYTAAVQAGKGVGDPVSVRIDPPVPYLQVVNRAVTGKRGSKPTLAVGRRSGADREIVEVTGSAPAGGDAKDYYRSVLDPVGYADAVLRMQLAANGISVTGKTRREPIPEAAFSVVEFPGHPVSEIARLCLKYSNNSIAESLVKALGAHAAGAPGSWKNGPAALRSALANAGLPLDGVVIVDGSGLAYENRVTPRLLVAVLRWVDRDFQVAPEFIAGLPIAGRDGTLKKRAGSSVNAVRAKTGLLTRVTALSGYARLADESEAVFALLVNDFRSSDDRAMNAVDAFAAALSRASLPPAPVPSP